VVFLINQMKRRGVSHPPEENPESTLEGENLTKGVEQDRLCGWAWWLPWTSFPGLDPWLAASMMEIDKAFSMQFMSFQSKWIQWEKGGQYQVNQINLGTFQMVCFSFLVRFIVSFLFPLYSQLGVYEPYGS
jgi:hypothetical protein